MNVKRLKQELKGNQFRKIVYFLSGMGIYTYTRYVIILKYFLNKSIILFFDK